MNDNNGNNTLTQLLKSVEEPDVKPTAENDSADATLVLGKHDELFELGEDFDFDGFQVVRREFFAHLREPSVTFNN